MAQSPVAVERKCLDDAARAYERKGYRIVTEPDSTQIPDFLTGFQPDLIAYGDQENVVVEVRSSVTLPQSRDMVSLADVVNEQPGWRFELIVTKPPPQEEVAGLDWWEARRRVADARELMNDQMDAAAVLAWSAAEATMRLIAKRHNVNLGSTQRNTPLYLVKRLFSLGLLSREDYDILEDGIRLRDLIVHGYRASGPMHGEMLELIASVERLLTELSPQPTS